MYMTSPLVAVHTYTRATRAVATAAAGPLALLALYRSSGRRQRRGQRQPSFFITNSDKLHIFQQQNRIPTAVVDYPPPDETGNSAGALSASGRVDGGKAA